MKNRDVKMRERFLQREDDRLFRKEYKRILKEKQCLYRSTERIEVQRYVHMAFVYACETCYEKRLMWVEKGLEEMCNPSLKEKSGLPHKPTPFVITCPKCGGDVVVRKTKKGRTYYGCEKAPECDFMVWQKPSGEKCPKCGNALLEKGGRLVCADEQCGYVKVKEKQ